MLFKFNRDSILNIKEMLGWKETEICGYVDYYDREFFFMDDPTAESTSKYCIMRDENAMNASKTMRFHTHIEKCYPSIEDIQSTLRRGRIMDVILTKWGVWVMSVPKREPVVVREPHKLQAVYDKYSYPLYISSKSKLISLKDINSFITKIMWVLNNSIHIRFKNWEMLEADDYIV
jgi:hypothetical protein